ncbi:hypothetical protein [Pseudoalteromonas sp.]|uniref:hypothetical protein n=1 Tax=Pseudoalteromonas sp. TaxID=53249 RepID=UPI003567A8E4
MRYLLGLFSLFAFQSLASSNCYKVIEKEETNRIIESCFRVVKTELHMSFKDAILYEKLDHDFGSFLKPSREFELFKKVVRKGGNSDLMLAYARSVELAFNTSKTKWAGIDSGIVSSKDVESGVSDGYEEYISAIKKEYERWYLLAALADNREAQIQYINKRIAPKKYGMPLPPKDEVEMAFNFAVVLYDKKEPSIDEVIVILDEMLKEYNKPIK